MVVKWHWNNSKFSKDRIQQAHASASLKEFYSDFSQSTTVVLLDTYHSHGLFSPARWHRFSVLSQQTCSAPAAQALFVLFSLQFLSTFSTCDSYSSLPCLLNGMVHWCPTGAIVHCLDSTSENCFIWVLLNMKNRAQHNTKQQFHSTYQYKKLVFHSIICYPYTVQFGLLLADIPVNNNSHIGS